MSRYTCLDCGVSLLEPGVPTICAAGHLPGALEYADELRSKLEEARVTMKEWAAHKCCGCPHRKMEEIP